jgi:ABC-type phosphate/phosphonate transport system substrate-binding protein
MRSERIALEGWESRRDIVLERFASYPVYDGTEYRGAVNAFWTALRPYFVNAGCKDVPLTLDRDRRYGEDPEGNCFFSQVCSYTLLTTAKGQFTVLGAPGYEAPGCHDVYHRSFIVVRDVSYVERLEDLRGKTFAVNEANSNTGMNLPRALFARGQKDGEFFGRVVVSGSHLLSADMVATGRADAAAIDCVTFALWERYRPIAVKRLRIVADTPAARTPPFVTSRNTKLVEVDAMREALRVFFTDPATRAVRDALLLPGIDFCDLKAYTEVMKYEQEAIKYGYPVLK